MTFKMYLPSDEMHPPRLDLPIIRHLTYSETHAFELGIYFGLVIVWAMTLGQEIAAFTLLLAIIRKVTTKTKKNDERSAVVHDIGFHDVRKEPPYFGAGTVIVVGTYGLYLVLIL